MEAGKQELTPKGYELLELIRSAGGWIDRQAIAKLQGKNRLHKWDAELLGRLAELGMIEVQRKSMPGRVGYKELYRAK